MKTFNTTAVCIPEKHYMVDISEKVKEIKMLDDIYYAGSGSAIVRPYKYDNKNTYQLIRLQIMENVEEGK